MIDRSIESAVITVPKNRLTSLLVLGYRLLFSPPEDVFRVVPQILHLHLSNGTLLQVGCEPYLLQRF